MSHLKFLIDQIDLSRKYTEDLLNNIEPGDWFRIPTDGVTHIAWQVGHLAIAQFNLAVVRTRGRQPGDDEIIPEEFGALFGKGSVPTAEPEKYPSPEEIRAVFDRSHQFTIQELRGLSEDVLDEKTEPPHRVFSTKGGALQWCALHEMLHAGQIGLVRRELGNKWLR